MPYFRLLISRRAAQALLMAASIYSCRTVQIPRMANQFAEFGNALNSCPPLSLQQQESDAVDDEEAGAGERAPLLGSSPKKSLSEQGSLQ